MTAEEVELLVRIEAALAPVDALQRAETPRPEKRRDPRRPCPLAHAVEPLAVFDLVAIEKLLVAEDVAMRMHDPFRESRRARGVVQLRRILGGGVAHDRLSGSGSECLPIDDENLRRRAVEAAGIRVIRDDELRPRIGKAVSDRIVAVQNGHRK